MGYHHDMNASDEEPDDENSLEDRIENEQVTSQFQSRSKSFLPESCVRDLVTRSAIIEELNLNELDEDEEALIDWIYERAPKVFLIHISMELKSENLLRSLFKFQEHGIDDAQLSVENPIIDWSKRMPSYFLPASWKKKRAKRLFHEERWKFFSPVFNVHEIDYDLATETILPFIKEYPDDAKSGAFSRVHRVEIHPAHQTHGFTEVGIKEIFLHGPTDTRRAAENEWEIEASNLNMTNGLDHDHTVKCLAAIRRGGDRYFMFPWANGGSLREFWKEAPQQEPKRELVCQVIKQLRGLADALCHLHNYPVPRAESHNSAIPEVNIVLEDGRPAVQPEESLRHGDLKPENILRFFDGDNKNNTSTNVGTLKLADMGLAKHHHVGTQYRKAPTSTRYGTVLYEAPEAATETLGRSRLYDIWSMGCITFEFILWMLYGNQKIEELYDDMPGAGQQTSQYFEIHSDGTGERPVVHPTVRRWMNHLRTNDPECNSEYGTAIGDLLEVVRTKLLVIDLPPNRASAIGAELFPGPLLALPRMGEDKRLYRAKAGQFRDALDEIISRFSKETYILTGISRHNVIPPYKTSGRLLTIRDAQQRNSTPVSKTEASGRLAPSSSIARTGRADYTLPPLEGWEFPVDNDFAAKVIAEVGAETLAPQSAVPATLCEVCNKLNFWKAGFYNEVKSSDLKRRSSTCDFCRVLWDIHSRQGHVKSSKVRFKRTESALRLSGETGDYTLPCLSIIRSADLEVPTQIQIGFPELPQPGTAAFFALLRLWLRDCDEEHSECQSVKKSPLLPTRLIDVGANEFAKVRLLETKEEQTVGRKYLALSHPWGDRKIHPPFSTLREDPSGRGRDLASFKRGIRWEDMPATFKHAIEATRALGIRYLWIDSLCIIQGRDGDFNDEAKHMESVFSGAYCVLAASRASGQHDGFLKSTKPRDYLTFKRENEKPFYICRAIDDFSRDVLEGSMNRRGWVLQERALARRTIYFTETQTYFECGKGVRCETLTRMHNNMADFLGDPRFPAKAMKVPRGLKIRYFQDLYRQYSRLDFTHIEDRPIAIKGLENRLLEAYGTVGSYGIFDDGPGNGLFHRSLLWQRGEDEPSPGLSRILFPPERNFSVPTWSWMRYRGGIDYLDPPFEQTDWEKNDIHPPFTRGLTAAPRNAETAHQGIGIELIATVRNFRIKNLDSGEAKLVYDTDKYYSNGTQIQCVVVAKSKGGRVDQQKKHYVLLVSPTQSLGVGGDRIYERVGAGYMSGTFIMLDKPGTAARIR